VPGPDFSEIFRRYKEALGQAQQSEGKTIPGGGKMSSKFGFLGFAIPALLLVILVSSSVVIVGPGQRGVVLNFGAVSPNVWEEGLHFKIPVYQNVVRMDVRVQKETTEAAAPPRTRRTSIPRSPSTTTSSPTRRAGSSRTSGRGTGSA
jgi:hypothetical protein